MATKLNRFELTNQGLAHHKLTAQGLMMNQEITEGFRQGSLST